VVITTTGVDRDDAFSVRAAGELHPANGATPTVVINELSSGSHQIALEGIAPNCTVAGGPSRTVPVERGQTAEVQYAVSCVALTGALGVTTSITGPNPDPDGFTVQVGATPVRTIGVRDSTFVTGLTAGDYPVTLGGLAPNCTAAGQNPRTVRVTVGGMVRDTARTTYAVTCMAVGASLRITTNTAGVQLDPDGYTITIDAASSSTPIGTNATTTITGVTAEDHAVRLNGLAPNCSVSGPNPQFVTVGSGAVLDVLFNVTCGPTAGDIRVIAQTTGQDIDADGYTFVLDNAPVLAVPVNGAATVSGVAVGSHQGRLDGVASNCTVATPNPRPVTVVGGGTVTVTFNVSCIAVSRIQINTTTTGADIDPNGYTITAVGPDASDDITLPATGTVTFDPLPQGTYTVALTNLAPNCEVSGGATRTVAATGPTAAVSFAVACATLERIAFNLTTNNADIYTSKADGSDMRQLTNNAASDLEPSWSAAAGRIAFASYRDGNGEIYVMDEAGLGQTRLTTNAAHDYMPSWSPDGRRIAFVSERDGNAEIYVMDADGSNVVRVTNDPARDFDPAWSPDGTKLAFTRGDCDNVSCMGNVWVVNPDGQGLRQLTETGLDAHPAWSADGVKIAFSRLVGCVEGSRCNFNIAVMNADGTQETVLPGDDFDEVSPFWSSTGTRIVLALLDCDYFGCSSSGIRMIRADGSDPIQIVNGIAFNPVFRR
jgi:TolB protein